MSWLFDREYHFVVRASYSVPDGTGWIVYRIMEATVESLQEAHLLSVALKKTFSDPKLFASKDDDNCYQNYDLQIEIRKVVVEKPEEKKKVKA